MKRSVNRALVARAAAQRGLLCSRDVRELAGEKGVASLLAEGWWRELLPGVLAPAGSVAAQDLLETAAMLWEPRSVLSHGNAARRNGFWVPDEDRVWVTVEFDAPKRPVAGLRLVRSRRFELRYETDGLHRWTHADRTLVDLAMTLSRPQLEASLLSAVRSRATSAAAVAEAASCLRTRPGTSTLLAITALWEPQRESLLEDRLDALVRAAVPDERVERQHVLLRRDGSRHVRIDVAVPDLRLAFEADGLLHHSTDAQVAADQARDRSLLARGWQTVRFREGSLDDSAAVRRDVRAIVLRRRQDLRVA
ncbi:MAG: endonuclease domain-containing protein [Mycobacteriales bacterium]